MAEMSKKVKLQIPVPKKVAEEVAYFAEQWDRTQSEMAAIILDVAIKEDRQSVGARLLKRILNPISSLARPSSRGKTTQDISETVRLQVVVDQDVEESCKRWGTGFR